MLTSEVKDLRSLGAKRILLGQTIDSIAREARVRDSHISWFLSYISSPDEVLDCRLRSILYVMYVRLYTLLL